MSDPSLLVFAIEKEAPPLRLLLGALTTAGYLASIGVSIAGDATDAQLDAVDWEDALVRWKEPELHEVYLIEREIPGVDEFADAAIAAGLRHIQSLADSAGRLIVSDHLRKTQAVYAIELQPPLFDDEDHPAWAALDVVLRTLAENADGLIYAENEGFYDADGEMLLDESGEEDE